MYNRLSKFRINQHTDKITSIKVFPVTIPITPVYSSKQFIDNITRTLVCVSTNSTCGWGETNGNLCVNRINDLASGLIGKNILANVFEHKNFIDKIDYGTLQLDERINNMSVLAIKMALLDIEAKNLKIPLYEYLRLLYNVDDFNNKAEFSSYVFPTSLMMNPDEFADTAKKLVDEEQSEYLEFKIGTYNLQHDINTISTVRKKLGDKIKIGVDANMTYDYMNACELIKQTKKYDLDLIEEPVHSVDEMNKLSCEYDCHISTHCIDETIKHYPPLSIVPDIHTDNIFKLIKKYPERKIWLRSNFELGISFAMMCHISYAIKFSRPSQSLMHLVNDDLLISRPWTKVPGGYTLNSKTYGLGIIVDEEKIAQIISDV